MFESESRRFDNWRTTRRFSPRASLFAHLVWVLVTTLLLATPSSMSAQTIPDAQLPILTPNQPVERDLAGNQSHSYQLTLSEGTFVFVAVEQRGIDVVVRMFDPSGTIVSEVDSPNGISGQEPLKMITAATATYRIEISSLEANASAGKYEARLIEMRPAAQKDRDLLAARKKYDEAVDLANQLTRPALTASLSKYEEAITLSQRAGNVDQEILALINFAGANRLLGNLTKGLELGGRALKLAENLGDKAAQARALTLAGGIYRNLGDYDQALRATDQANRLYDEVGDKTNAAVTTRAIGEIYGFLGELEKARDYYARAITLYRKLGNKAGEATTLHSNGYTYLIEYDWPKALDNFRRALTVWQQLENRTEEAVERSFIGLEYARAGNQPDANENLTEAVRLRPTVGNFDEATILTNVAHAYGRLHDHEKAANYFAEALLIWRSIGDRRGEAIARKHYSMVLRDQGRLAEARVQSDQAIALLEFMRDHAGTPELQAAFVASLYDFYEYSIDLLMRLHAAEPTAGHDLAALAFSERVKLRNLRELLVRGHVDLRAGANHELLDREQTVNERMTDALDQMARLLRGKYTDTQRIAAEENLSALQTEQRNVLDELRRRDPRYAALTQPQPLDAIQIQQLLADDDTIILEYSLGLERSYLWLISRGRVQSFPLPAKAAIERVALQVYQWLTSRQPKRASARARSRPDLAAADRQYGLDAAQLSELLLGPVAAQLGSKRLLIVADGALQYLPFGVLPTPSVSGEPLPAAPRPLIVDHEIVNLPSASVISVLRAELDGRPRAPQTVAVLADPVYEPNDPRVRRRMDSPSARPTALPTVPAGAATVTTAPNSAGARTGDNLTRLLFSRDEADAIISVTPPGKGMLALDFKANRRLAMSDELSQYRILHFSSHGLLDSRHPELSGLVLSLVDEAGKPREGYLRLHEIYNLHLNADLVVLSACQTALGKDVRGEGLIGLTRGFMYAGVPRLVASLWEVDDAATTELMKRFYRGMLVDQQPAATALRNAQIEMLSKPHWRSPYYWGAFVLQGEWK